MERVSFYLQVEIWRWWVLFWSDHGAHWWIETKNFGLEHFYSSGQFGSGPVEWLVDHDGSPRGQFSTISSRVLVERDGEELRGLCQRM